MVYPDEDMSRANPIAGVGLTLLLLWSFAVTAHVLRHAMSCPFLLGLAFAIVFNLTSELILDLFIDFDALKP